MDIEKIIIILFTAFVATLSTLISTNLWNLWREKTKIKLEERNLLSQLSYQFIGLSDSTVILRKQIREHSNSLTFITEYADFYIKNLDYIYEQIEGLLKELAKSDPITAAGIRNAQYNDASNHLFILKSGIYFITEQAKINKAGIPDLLKANQKHIDNTLTTMLEISKITMYITANKIDKDALKSVSTLYPDQKLIKEFSNE